MNHLVRVFSFHSSFRDQPRLCVMFTLQTEDGNTHKEASNEILMPRAQCSKNREITSHTPGTFLAVRVNPVVPLGSLSHRGIFTVHYALV